MAKESVTTASGEAGVLDTSLTKSTLHVVLAAIAGAALGAAVSDVLNIDLINKVKTSSRLSDEEQRHLLAQLKEALANLDNRDEVIARLRSELVAITPEDGVHQSHVDAVQSLLDESNNSLATLRKSLETCSADGMRKAARIRELEQAALAVNELELRIASLQHELGSIIRDDGITQEDVDSAVVAAQASFDGELQNIVASWHKFIDRAGNSMQYATRINETPSVAAITAAIDSSLVEGAVVTRSDIGKHRDVISQLLDRVQGSVIATSEISNIYVKGSESLEDLDKVLNLVSSAIASYHAPNHLSVYNLGSEARSLLESYYKGETSKDAMITRTVTAFEESSLDRVKSFKFENDGTVTYKDVTGNSFRGEALLAYCLFNIDGVDFTVTNNESMIISDVSNGTVIQPKVTGHFNDTLHMRSLASAYLLRAYIRPEIAVILGFDQFYLMTNFAEVADRGGARSGYGASQSLRQWGAEVTLSSSVAKATALVKLNEAISLIWS